MCSLHSYAYESEPVYDGIVLVQKIFVVQVQLKEYHMIIPAKTEIGVKRIFSDIERFHFDGFSLFLFFKSRKNKLDKVGN